MKKPPMIRSMQLPPIMIQKYERYLPTAFDESLSILEKVNKVILYLHEYSELSEHMLTKWNEVYRWVMNEGLDEAIGYRLIEFIENGTIARIINEKIFSELNEKIDEVIIDFEVVKDDIADTLNELQNFKNQVEIDLQNFKNQLTIDLTNLVEELSVSIVVSKNAPSNPKQNSLWYEVMN